MRLFTPRLGICLAFSLATHCLLAKDNVKVEGRIHVGADIEQFKNGEPKYDAKLKFETKRKQGFEGRLALRTDSDHEIFLQDLYVDKKFQDSRWSMEFGKHKKRIGLEWQISERDRLSINRSFIYDQLLVFGYAGRETLLKFQYNPDENSETELSFTAAYNEATDSSVVFHGQTSIARDLNVGAWQLFQWDKIDEKRQLVWANALSFWLYGGPGHRFEWELFAGVDPFESEFERAFGNGKNVHFYATKLQYAYQVLIDDDHQESIMPFLHSAYYVYDAHSPNFNTVEAIIGTNYFFENMQLASEFALIGTNSKIEPDERNYDESEIRLEVSLYF